MTLLKCSCGYRLLVDEGKTFAVHLGHWRINKLTGRVTAQCPRCPVVHEIESGEGVGSQGVSLLRLMVAGT